jgi:N6-adenosine-specific RNA methylase IME4
LADLAADDCALLLWVTDPFLDRGIELIGAWGFTYKTVGFTWVKPNRVTSPASSSG